VAPASEATLAQLERILQNKNLRLSEVQRRLLNYLAEKSLAGEADDLKEYAVGVDAFGKPASYDPRQESVVRMHVARLRQKLAEYYRTDGADDPIIVDLPKGGFKMTFDPRPPRVQPPPATPVAAVPPAGRWLSRPALFGAAALLALATVVLLGWQISHARRVDAALPPGWTPELEQLWLPLLSPSRPLAVCIATPSYGTATGAFRLGQFLGSRKPDLLVTGGNQISMPEIAMDNVVFLGPVTGNRQVQALPAEQQIVLEPDGIHNLNPRPGEPAFLSDRPSADGQGVEESHALISHTPGLYGSGDILYLAGNHVSSVMAAVKAFTDPNIARTLVSKLRSPTGTLPHYYQVVLRVKSMDDMPVEISYMFHRELPASKH
jgi:hypothetical protein